jgi:hypothetical protein
VSAILRYMYIVRDLVLNRHYFLQKNDNEEEDMYMKILKNSYFKKKNYTDGE